MMWSCPSAGMARSPLAASSLTSRRQQLSAVVAVNSQSDDAAGLAGRCESDLGELLGAPNIARFRKHAPRAADFGIEMTAKHKCAPLAQPCRTLLDYVTRQLGHVRSRRLRPRRKRKNVQVRQAAFF